MMIPSALTFTRAITLPFFLFSDASSSSPSMENDERDGVRALGGETIEVWRDPG